MPFTLNIVEAPDDVSIELQTLDNQTPIYDILVDRVLYIKQVVNSTTSTFVDGVFYPASSPVVNYPLFEAEWEPFARGETTIVLPEGVNAQSAILLFSQTELEVATNHKNRVVGGDRIYLQNPELHPTTEEYVVFDKEVWLTNPGYLELGQDSFDYVCIRSGVL